MHIEYRVDLKQSLRAYKAYSSIRSRLLRSFKVSEAHEAAAVLQRAGLVGGALREGAAGAAARGPFRGETQGAGRAADPEDPGEAEDAAARGAIAADIVDSR